LNSKDLEKLYETAAWREPAKTAEVPFPRPPSIYRPRKRMKWHKKRTTAHINAKWRIWCAANFRQKHAASAKFFEINDCSICIIGQYKQVRRNEKLVPKIESYLSSPMIPPGIIEIK
jgi:hypothetical protein